MADFVNSKTMTVSLKVDTNALGNLAQSGETASGAKLASIPGIKKDANLANTIKVYDAFYGTIGGATFDSLSAVRTIKEGVAQ